MHRTPVKGNNRSDIVINYPSAKLGAVTRKSNEIKILLNNINSENLAKLPLYFYRYKLKVANFRDECNKIITESKDNLVPQEKLLKFEEWFQSHEAVFDLFIHEVKSFLHQEGIKTEEEYEVQSQESVSSFSKSTKSVSSSLRERLAEETAKAKAEAYYHEEQLQIERLRTEAARRKAEKQAEEVADEMEIQSKLREIELKKSTKFIEGLQFELDKVDRSTKEKIVLANSTQTSWKKTQDWINSNQHHNFRTPENLNDKTEPRSKGAGVRTRECNTDEKFLEVLNKQNEITMLLAKNQNKATLPKNQPITFDGEDLTTFKTFIQDFETLIEAKCDNARDRHHYLEKFTSGEPLQLVKSCRGADSSVSYNSAMALLKKEYGNEYLIANAYISKLNKWPDIKNEDGQSLRKLSIYLMSCCNIMNDMDSLNQLNSPQEIKKIVQKLPYKIRDKWRSQSHALIEATGIVSFREFSNFIYEQSSIMNTPLFGDISDDNFSKSKVKFSSTNKKSFATSINNKEDNACKFPPCIVCKKQNHTIQYCFFLDKKRPEDKRKLITEKKLCFKCLSDAHFSSACTFKPVCKKCSGKHLSVLHNINNASSASSKIEETSTSSKIEETSTSSKIEDTSTSSKTEDTSTKGKELKPSLDEDSSTASAFLCKHKGAGERRVSPAIPVQVRIKGMSNKITTYIGLDSFASDSFMKQGLLRKLKVKGVNTEIGLTTMSQSEGKVLTQVLNNLELYDLHENIKIEVPVIYCKDDWPFSKEDAPCPLDKEGFNHLNDIPFQYVDEEIGILIGKNMSDLLKPLEVVSGPPGTPFATRHSLGWALSGPIKGSSISNFSCHAIKLTEKLDINEKFEELCAREFHDSEEGNEIQSLENSKWEEIVKSSLKKTDDSHYEMNLPFRNRNVLLPYNRNQVLNRFLSLKRKLDSDAELNKEYCSFMKSMVKSGFAEKVPEAEIQCEEGKVWYLTHFATRHKVKRKLRIVFDCSLKYRGTSLNDLLLQGPDLANSLNGVLLRFREENFAIIGDINKMFYQVRVTKKHVDYLRFLWFSNTESTADPIEYRVLVHIFGAISSPSCANYALKQTARSDEAKIYSNAARATILNNFYVDDLLKSTPSEMETIKILQEVRAIISTGGFHLTGFSSNSRSVLKSIPQEEWAKDMKNINLTMDTLPNERALGVTWDTEEDLLGFSLKFEEKSMTKRGILSLMFSIYDPFGFATPALIPGKRLFQLTCRRKLQWDDELPDDLKNSCNTWIEGISLLEEYRVPRCYNALRDVCKSQLHIFCDGSSVAYCAVAYLRFENEKGQAYCSIVMSKSRLVPINNSSLTTIPRIELSAAKLAVQLHNIIKKELEIKINCSFFWTDSSTVIKYLNCENRTFQRFVANRVAYIRNFTDVRQWKHVPGKLNPADVGSRGTSTEDFLTNDNWKKGPEFLWQSSEHWPSTLRTTPVEENDTEVKKEKLVLSASLCETQPCDRLINSSSNLHKLKLRIAWMLHFGKWIREHKQVKEKINLNDINKAELALWRYVQHKQYPECFHQLESTGELLRNNKLRKLRPFIDNNKMIRVGGRMGNYTTTFDVKHPIIIPKNNHAVDLLLRNVHKEVGHLGRATMLSSLRRRFWMVGANSAVRKLINDCIACQKYQGKPSEQLMGDLPPERFADNQPAFSHIGIDAFGPFFVIRGRTKEKRYGLIFTCLASRAVHIEVLYTLSADSFINAFRRFQSRRGNVQTIISDNGTNFVGSERELRKAIADWNQVHLENWMQQRQIEWKFNPPTASHFGGIFEREIRTIRKVLSGLMSEQPMKLRDDGLNTLLCEVECILNSRPLTETSNDHNDIEALTPNHLLRQSSGITYPPGLFSYDDAYSKKNWKQIQYLADLFWKRWKREYLPLLNKRQKWTSLKPPHKKGDLVLVMDNQLPRNHWRLGRIVEVFPDKKGIIRVVDVKAAKVKGENGTTVIRRPIVKLILLKAASNL